MKWQWFCEHQWWLTSVMGMRLGLCCCPFFFIPSRLSRRWGPPTCSGVCTHASVNTESHDSKPVLYCRAVTSGLRPCTFLLMCLQHFQLSSASTLGVCSWFDLQCKQAGNLICWSFKHCNVCLISGTSSKKASKLYKYLPEKHTFLSPLFLSIHEGTVHGTYCSADNSLVCCSQWSYTGLQQRIAHAM